MFSLEGISLVRKFNLRYCNLVWSNRGKVYARDVRSVWMLLWHAEPLWIHKISGPNAANTEMAPYEERGPHHSEQLTWCTSQNGDPTEWTSRAYKSSMWAWTKFDSTLKSLNKFYKIPSRLKVWHTCPARLKRKWLPMEIGVGLLSATPS